MQPLTQSCSHLRGTTVLSQEQEAKNTSWNTEKKKWILKKISDIGPLLFYAKKKKIKWCSEFSIKVFYKE